MIWEAYCPELGPQAQYLEVEAYPTRDEVLPWGNLAHQTAPVRDVLSLSRDSREYALKVLPNTISLQRGQGVVRYAASRDLIVFELDPAVAENVLDWGPVTGFSDQVENLACHFKRMPWLSLTPGEILRVCASFRSLKNVLYTVDGNSVRLRYLDWCLTPHAHCVVAGRAPDMAETTYFWLDFSRPEVWPATPLEEMLEWSGHTLEDVEVEGTRFSEEEVARLRRVLEWPMMRFEYETPEEILTQIRASGPRP